MQVCIKMLKPNSHEWKQLCNPHSQTDGLFQVAARNAIMCNQRFDIAQQFGTFVGLEGYVSLMGIPKH